VTANDATPIAATAPDARARSVQVRVESPVRVLPRQVSARLARHEAITHLEIVHVVNVRRAIALLVDHEPNALRVKVALITRHEHLATIAVAAPVAPSDHRVPSSHH
jgi:hypothetical protein